MSQISFSVNVGLHDTFTCLCDGVLHRPPRAWRFQQAHPYRLRFLRQVIQWAGLLDPIHSRPTPLTADWLHQPPAEQVGILAEAWANQRDGTARQASLTRLLALPAGEAVTPAAFTHRTPAQRQRDIWLPLAWLGLLIPEPDFQAPTHLRRAPWPTPPARAADWVIADLTVSVPAPYHWPDLWLLEQAAELRAVGPPRQYTLTPACWHKAMTRGITASAILGVLERASGQPVSVAVWKLFSPPHPDVIAQPGVLLTFLHPQQLQQLTERVSWQKRLRYRLSPQQVWLPTAQAPLILRALQRQSLAVHSPPLPPGRVTPTATDRMQLTLAARVMQALAVELDLPAPLDENTLAALTRGLPLAHQRRLERSSQRQLETLRRHLPETPALYGSLITAPTQVHATLLTALEQGQTLQLHYQPPSPRPLITRAIVPLRLEPWGAHTYLIAHDLTRADLRTFRLDRIVQAAVLA